MKPAVLRSLNDEGAQRCVDFVRAADGRFAWAECRRDPEDTSGWRVIARSDGAGFVSEAAATEAARAAVLRLAEVHE